ncbi:MAG: hypothetical protein EBU81_12775 [Proteobacteria bacterium]|nr:hypothetical protein [Pseudomonadota bacterium]
MVSPDWAPHRAWQGVWTLARALEGGTPPEALRSIGFVSVFGVSSVPPRAMQVLVRLARHVPVHVHMLVPTLAFMDRHELRRAVAARAAARRDDDLEVAEAIGEQARNPLVQAFAAVAADAAEVIDSFGLEPERSGEHGDAATPVVSMLQAVQRGLMLDEAPDATRVEADASLQVHGVSTPTRAAEVIRLAAATLRESKEVLATKAPSSLRAAATRQNGELFLLLARTNTSPQPELEVSLPSSVAGSLLTWEVVAPDRFGTTEIMSATSPVRLNLPSTSVGLLRSRPFHAVKPTSIPSSSSFSTDTSKRATGGANLAQTLFQFPVGPLSSNGTTFLHLKTKSPSTSPVVVHLYSWATLSPDASVLQTGNFPFRKKELPQPGTSGLTVEGLGKEVEWVGAFTVDSTQNEIWVDVTSTMSREPKSLKSLLLARDLRYAGDTPEPELVEWESAELVFYPR